MPTTFLDLPEELILHIANFLYEDEQHGMRLVAKRIDRCISPIRFETLHCTGPTLRRTKSYILLSEKLSRGEELVFSRCTKKMILWGSGLNHFDRELPWLRLMNNLVPTLTNLHALEWSYWPVNDPVSNLVIDTFSAFGSLPRFRELKIKALATPPFHGFSLKSFSNLSSFSMTWELKLNVNQDLISDVADLLGRCPDLECFTFHIPRHYHPPDAPFLAHFFAGLSPTTRLKLKLLDVTGLHVAAEDFRVHLRLLPLKVLRLMFNRASDPPQQNSQICQLLLDNSIHLDELAIDTTHPPIVLDYLSSYSGLHHLEFRSRHPGADTPEGVHRFFSSVLPLHSATLRKLYLGWSVETPWTGLIAPENIAQIKRCQQLTTLYCYVTVSIGPTQCTDKVLRMWLETAKELPRFQNLRFYPTRRCQPPIRDGGFIWDGSTRRELATERAIEEFAQAAVNKLKADLLIPFYVSVTSPTLGP